MILSNNGSYQFHTPFRHFGWPLLPGAAKLGWQCLVLMGELRWSVITSNYMQSVYWSWVADVCLEGWEISSVTNDFIIMYMQTEAQ